MILTYEIRVTAFHAGIHVLTAHTWYNVIGGWIDELYEH